MQQKRRHWDPNESGCTFQPKLGITVYFLTLNIVTDPKRTKKLCEARVKSMENRNSFLQQAMITTHQKNKTRNLKNVRSHNCFPMFYSLFRYKIPIRKKIYRVIACINMGTIRLFLQIYTKRNKSKPKGMKNYLKILREKEMSWLSLNLLFR